MKPRVLMFGWEFPPFKSGGLGTACYALTKGLARQGCKITFAMPVAPENARARFVKLVGTAPLAKNLSFKPISSTLTAYATSQTYDGYFARFGVRKNEVYGQNLFEEVERYSAAATQIAKCEEYDVIHVHDWMTYRAGILAKKISKKPLVAHLHATEFDRTAGNPDPRISNFEHEGLLAADKIITNSNLSKKNIVKHYAINPSKIDVVHWGIDERTEIRSESSLITEQVVLFLGRVTIQKGPDYFIEVAKRVLDYLPKTKFVIAGDGDMLPCIINRTAELGISDRVIFTGNLRGDDVHRAFASASLYVMPSVSEPFGLVALESLQNGTPVLMSRQSGVSEVVKHALKVDFWDIDEMVNKIVGVLRNPALRRELSLQGTSEIKRFTIDLPAKKVIDVYTSLLNTNIKKGKGMTYSKETKRGGQ